MFIIIIVIYMCTLL